MGRVVCCLAAGGCAQAVEVSNLCGRIRISKEDMAAPCAHHPLEHTQHSRKPRHPPHASAHAAVDRATPPQCCGSRIDSETLLTHLADRPPLAVVAAQRMHADPVGTPEYVLTPSKDKVTHCRLAAHSIPSE
jgi:hypothetical protein